MVKVKDILQTSKAVLIFETAYKKYSLFEERLDRIYKNSALYAKTKMFFSGITVILRYSFLGRITEDRGGDNLKETLESSRFINCLFKIRNDWRRGVIGYWNTSFTVKHARELKSEFSISPVKSGSIIVVTAILANLFFYALLRNFMHKEIGLLGWVINGLLFFTGLAGLYCKVSLEGLKKSSLFLKWITR